MNDFTNTPALALLPAVDVAGGKAVRLTQGEAGSETNYGDPVDAAAQWQDQGAEWLHLVDLDAAFGRGANTAVIRRVIKQVRGLNVELSGGIRDDASLEAALETGVTRINLGTAALENPEWAANIIGRYGDAIAVGLDVRGTTLAARGWTQDAGDIQSLCQRERAGVQRLADDRALDTERNEFAQFRNVVERRNSTGCDDRLGRARADFPQQLEVWPAQRAVLGYVGHDVTRAACVFQTSQNFPDVTGVLRPSASR